MTNVRQASVTPEVGIVSLEIEGEREEIKRAIAWLEELGIKVEPVEINTDRRVTSAAMCRARATAAVRVLTASLSKMCSTCLSTVRVAAPMVSPISALDLPSAMRQRTSYSRRVRPNWRAASSEMRGTAWRGGGSGLEQGLEFALGLELMLPLGEGDGDGGAELLLAEWFGQEGLDGTWRAASMVSSSVTPVLMMMGRGFSATMTRAASMPSMTGMEISRTRKSAGVCGPVRRLRRHRVPCRRRGNRGGSGRSSALRAPSSHHLRSRRIRFLSPYGVLNTRFCLLANVLIEIWIVSRKRAG